MSLLLTTAVFGAMAAAVVLIYRHVTRFRGTLEALGVPVDPTSDLRAHEISYKDHDLACLKKYGLVWGRYVGQRAELFVADPEILKELLVKRFDDFTDRQHFALPEKHISLIDSSRKNWKEMRKALSPTFTSGKIKGMFEPMKGVSDRMMAHMEKKRRESPDGVVDVKPIYQSLSLDSISNCAFGIETDSFGNPENKLFDTCLKVFTGFTVNSAMESFVFVVQSFLPFLMNHMDWYGKKYWDELWNTTKAIAEGRTEKRGDFIDRVKEVKESGLLTEDQAYAQGIGFFQAGFETTSNTMSTLSYALAKNPAVQDRVYGEVREALIKNGGVIDHDAVADMPLLEATIYENLRMYDPVIRIDRTCLKDSQLGGMPIKKGTVIQIPIHAIHHNPDFHPDPETFDPDRFTGEDGVKVGAAAGDFTYVAFGGGPRLCVGMRFAMAEMKMALAKVLARYRIAECADTRLDCKKGDMFFLSYPEVRVRLEEKDSE